MTTRFNKPLGAFSLTMLSIVAIFNPRTLPLMAEYGLASIFYYLAAGLLYFIPFSMVCAELAAAWPERGGLYAWGRTAFGYRAGFLAIWLEWISNVVGWPASLAFISATLAYVISPQLADDKYYTIIFMLVVFWLFTLVNFLGIKIATWVSTIGLIIGTLIPTLLIIILGWLWFLAPTYNHLQLHWHDLLPPFHLHSAALFIGVMLGLAGMQITSFHAHQVQNPKRSFPLAIGLSTIIILLVSITGSLAIANSIPRHSISLLAGNIQVIALLLTRFHLHWLINTMAVAMALGACAMLNAWIGGPCKGLLAAMEEDSSLRFFSKKNNQDEPTTLLFVQAIIVSILAALFLFTPTITNSFWLVTDLSAMMCLLMNIILFAAIIKLRYSHPQQSRSYQIPGGKLGVWLVGGIGIIISLIGIGLGFIPPQQIHSISTRFYEGFLVLGLLVFIAPVLLVKKR